MKKVNTALAVLTALVLIIGCTKYDDFGELDKLRMVGNWKLENISKTNKCNGDISTIDSTEVLTLKNNYLVDYKTNDIYIDNKGKFSYYYRLDTLVLETTDNKDCPITSKYRYIRMR